ncbi:hypothetical protein STANM337S_06483 [Streptomyces tanashiensis]
MVSVPAYVANRPAPAAMASGRTVVSGRDVAAPVAAETETGVRGGSSPASP